MKPIEPLMQERRLIGLQPFVKHSLYVMHCRQRQCTTHYHFNISSPGIRKQGRSSQWARRK
jgi:hypothetical protein